MASTPQEKVCLFTHRILFIPFLYFTLILFPPLQNKWLRSINRAVDQVLGGGGQGSSPGVAAMSRTATYTFTADERFRDAQYSGGWLAGRVHGRSGGVVFVFCATNSQHVSLYGAKVIKVINILLSEEP